jgi:hypothetical protein
MYVCMYVYIRMYVCMYTYVCMYACIYVCMYACMCLCVCVCVCVCTFTHRECTQVARGEELLEELAAAYSIKRRSETNGSGKLIYLVDPLSREVQLEATSSPACCCTCV